MANLNCKSLAGFSNPQARVDQLKQWQREHMNCIGGFTPIRKFLCYLDNGEMLEVGPQDFLTQPRSGGKFYCAKRPDRIFFAPRALLRNEKVHCRKDEAEAIRWGQLAPTRKRRLQQKSIPRYMIVLSIPNNTIKKRSPAPR